MLWATSAPGPTILRRVAGLANPPFGAVCTPRIWNGIVFYDLAGVPTLPVWVMALLLAARLALGGLTLRARVAER